LKVKLVRHKKTHVTASREQKSAGAPWNAYRAGPRLCGLDMGLEVQRGVEIAARVAVASPLHCVHADRDCAVFVGRHGVGGMRKAALTFSTFARPSLVLATDL